MTETVPTMAETARKFTDATKKLQELSAKAAVEKQAMFDELTTVSKEVLNNLGYSDMKDIPESELENVEQTIKKALAVKALQMMQEKVAQV